MKGRSGGFSAPFLGCRIRRAGDTGGLLPQAGFGGGCKNHSKTLHNVFFGAFRLSRTRASEDLTWPFAGSPVTEARAQEC